jgi:5-formyltetrahydrofolate cyclo-ligase
MRYRNKSTAQVFFQTMKNSNVKADLRRTLIAARKTMSADMKVQADERIASKLLAWLDTHQVSVLGAYLPMAGEPDLTPLYATLPGRGIQVVMPVVLEKNQPLHFVHWQAGDALARDASGTLAPTDKEHFVKPDAVLAPCVGYNDAQYRLGYGGGYFDRTLAQSPRPLAVGIAYAITKADFPADSFDIPLDVILTD